MDALKYFCISSFNIQNSDNSNKESDWQVALTVTAQENLNYILQIFDLDILFNKAKKLYVLLSSRAKMK